MKVGVCARTAAVSGRTSSSLRSAMTMAGSRIRQGHQGPDRSQSRPRSGCGEAKRACRRRSTASATPCSRPTSMARITRINPVAERLTGWSETEALGRPIDEVFNIVNEDTRVKAAQSRHVACWRRALSSGSPITPRSSRATGLSGRSPTAARPSATRAGRTRGAVLVFRDVTDERRADDALRQSEEKLRLMIASISDYAIFMLDPQGRVASWNPGAEQITGYREDEILGVHFSRFFTSEDIANGRPAGARRRRPLTDDSQDEGWRTCKDGSRFWAERRHCADARLRRPARRLRQDDARSDPTSEDGRRARQAGAGAGSGPAAGRIPVDRLTRAQDPADRPAAATCRARGTEHRRPTRSSRRHYRPATRVGERLAQLIEALLDVSRIASGQLELNREACDLGGARARDRRTTARSRQPRRLRAVDGRAGRRLRPLGPPSHRAGADESDLQRDQVRVRAAHRSCRLFAKRETAVLQVRDNGPGIAEDQLSRIFERFERAASARHYGGMGLGLYVARQIAEAHGGTITVANVPDGGACFTVRLPLAPPTAAA